MENLHNSIGIVMKEDDFDFLCEEASFVNYDEVTDVYLEAKQKVKCPNEDYCYLFFDNIEWDKAKPEISVLLDVLAELWDYEFLRISKPLKKVLEQYDGNEHQPLLSLNRDFTIQFSQ